MKKYITLFLTLMVVCAVVCLFGTKTQAATVASGTCGAQGDNLTWIFDDQGTLSISGSGAMENWSTDVNVPWFSVRSSIKTINIGNGVTTIGSCAFAACQELSSVIISDSVTTISNSAFYDCDKLTSLPIGKNVTTIGDSAFAHCDGYNSLTIGESVTTIGAYAFAYCDNLDSVSIGRNVTSIGYSAFVYCESLNSVTCGESVTTIGEFAFAFCYNLDSVIFGESVTTIGAYAFDSCEGLASVAFGDSVTYIGESAFQRCLDVESVHISSLKAWCEIDFANAYANPLYISSASLYLNGRLVSGDLVIPEGTRSIGISVFKNCADLTSVTIPDSVTNIGAYAFYSCSGLTTLTIGNGVTVIDESAFSFCSKLRGELTIPDSVTTIGGSAFYYCDDLNSVSIPDCVTSIGNSAFYYCSGLTSLTIGENVTKIGDSAFRYCSGLTGELIIPESVTTIGNYAFYYCRKLTSVTVGSNVRKIGSNAFNGCSKLNEVYFLGSAPVFESGVFYNLNIVAYYPAYDDTWTDDVRLNYGGEIVWSAYGGPKKFDIDVSRMILGNALDFQFGVAMGSIPDINGYYARIEKNWADGSVTTKIVPATQWINANPYWAIVYDGLAAKEMSDVFFVTIYNSEGVAVSNTKTDSVRDYVMRNVDQQNQKGKAIMVDMLNYGAAAQTRFDYNTSDLANNRLTELQRTWGTSNLAPLHSKQVKDSNFMGSRLILNSRIQLQMAFTNMTRDMYAVYTYTDNNNNLQAFRVDGADFIDAGGVLAVELNQLVYADARTCVVVIIYNADGSIYSIAADSIEGYAARNTTGDDVLVALMKFSDSAKAYLY